jgi:diacylglycerol kinase (ATP)
MHAIKRRRGAFTVLEPKSAMDTLKLARMAAGVAKDKRVGLLQTRTRGRVTALVACGGDGTANLVARAALQAGMPIGILPLGRHNNIARSLYGSDEPEAALRKITKMSYRQINTATVSGQIFFGSIGIGYFPELMELLDGVKPPRFAFQWAKLGARIAAAVRPRKMIIKVDSFRFEVRPHILQVNLLPYTAGLNLNPASIFDDDRAEIIFDVGADEKDLSEFTRQLYKRGHLYGATVRLFRGSAISFQPAMGRMLYLDGELIELPTNVVEVKIGSGKLKVFC